jgi:cell division protein FtsW (lipid II flippase)
MKSSSGQGIFAAIALMAIVGLLGLMTVAFFPNASASREVSLAHALVARPLPENTSFAYTPEALCSEWTGLQTSDVDCRNGFGLDTMSPRQGEQALAAWENGLKFVHLQVDRFKLLALSLEIAAPESDDNLRGLRLILQQRIGTWQERLADLEVWDKETVGVAQYARLFYLMLDLNGSSYDAANNRFGVIHRHLARLTEPEPAVLQRATRLQTALTWMPWAICCVSAGLMLLGWWRAKWTGLLLAAGFSAITWLGLLIAADASVHFGEGSTVFLLNPLGNQLARQHHVLWIGSATLIATAVLASKLSTLVQWPLKHLKVTILVLLAAIGTTYQFLGSAMGSETLKLSMAVLAGLVTAAHGRSVHLASKLAPQSMSAFRIFRVLRLQHRQQNKDVSIDAQDLISMHLAKPIYLLALFGALGLAMAAMAFQDLGAALVTAIVAVCALFLVFGARITAAVLVLMGLVAAGLCQTAKMQERIALMLDPMRASVSDFARLVAFSNAAQDSGFPLGQMAWCNSGGVCVPPQVLSDYMPTILSGLFGFDSTVVYFCIFLLTIILMGRFMLHEYMTRKGPVRTLAITAFYLLVCTGVQTVITFLGNWRIIPLTGIGAPLLSIGLSSSLVPCIALGLFLAVKGWPRHFVLDRADAA